MASLSSRSLNYTGFKGSQPAADYVSKDVRRQIAKVDVPEYMKFMQARLASEAVDGVRELAGEAGCILGKISDEDYFVSDSDVGINGAYGSACALVRPGRPDGSLRIIFAHTDAPSLRIASQPIYIQTDADNALVCPTVALSTVPNGGIRADDWYGSEVDIAGSVFLRGLEKKVCLPGRIRQKSLHVDDTEEAKTFLGLKVDTGYRTIGELYKSLGMKDDMDFARASLFVVPHFSGKNGRLVGNELGGYGHDDRACLWAANRACLDAMKTGDGNTMIVLGLDREEVGSTGSSGAYHGFAEAVIGETLARVHGAQETRGFNLPQDLYRGLMGGFPAISADGDVALGDLEIEGIPDDIDLQNSAKLGWGPFISADDSEFDQRGVSREHIGKLMDMFEKGIGGRTPRNRYQIIGNCNTPDSPFAAGTFSDALDRHLPCVDVGIPMSGLHHPRVETVNIFDLHFAKEFYRLYCEAS